MKFAYLLVVLAALPLSLPLKAEEKSGQAKDMPCVEVQIGQDRASQMNCLNQAMQRAVEREHNTPIPEAPITAQSASNKVGVYNDAAARQMMGNAFGISAQPQRPRASFTSPLLPR
jgi:hypothetical protein